MKSRLITRSILFSIVVLFALYKPAPLAAQCAMCKQGVESATQDPANKTGRGLNSGIMYLLAAPYLVAGGAAYLWYRNRKRQKRMFAQGNVQFGERLG